LLLGALAVGNIRLRTRHADNLAVDVLDRARPAEHPALITVGVPHPVFVLEVCRHSLDVCVDRGSQLFHVVRVHPTEPLIGTVGQVLLFAANH